MTNFITSKLSKLLAISFIGAAAVVQAAVQPAKPLLEASALLELLDEKAAVVVVDLRSAEEYAEAHLPGAVHAPYGKFGWRETVDGVIGQLPPLEKINQRIGSLGITPQQLVVVVPSSASTSSIGAGARVYWTFKVLGHEKVSLLNGGFAAWQELGGPTEGGEYTPEATTAAYPGNINNNLLITFDALSQQGDRYQVVDARPDGQHLGYEKHPKAAVGGTLPEAERFPQHELFQEGIPRFKNTLGLKEVAKQYGLELGSGQPIVSFCNTGHWAATTWFALSELLGEEGVALYDGSWVEWSNKGGKVVNAKNRFQLFWHNLFNN